MVGPEILQPIVTPEVYYSLSFARHFHLKGDKLRRQSYTDAVMIKKMKHEEMKGFFKLFYIVHHRMGKNPTPSIFLLEK